MLILRCCLIISRNFCFYQYNSNLIAFLCNKVQKCTTQFHSIKTTTIKPTPVKNTKQSNANDLRGKENLKYYQSNQNKLNNNNNLIIAKDNYQQIDKQMDKQQQSSIEIKEAGNETKLNVSLDLEVPCCKIVRKAIEKVLVRYEKATDRLFKFSRPTILQFINC